MRVEILCTGDEILTGKTINTNYSHIARRLGDFGLDVIWGTTVGDDRATLLAAFRQAGERADAVIVNGGLGPTVDDLSQEVAAEACGVPLVLSDYWMERMTQSYARRGRVMPANNKKQAMLPKDAEFIDNPIGTACGFAVTIGKARFLFTPGVPREMRRMLDEQVIPRLLKLGGITGVTRLKRFHSFGIGESRADEIAGRHSRPGDRRRHQARLPGALSAARDQARGARRRRGRPCARAGADRGRGAQAPGQLRRSPRTTQTMEGVILAKLREAGHTLAVAETFTGGNIAARIAPLVGAEAMFKQRRGHARRRAAGRGAAQGERRQPGAEPSPCNSTRAPIGRTSAPPSSVGIADAQGSVARQARLVGGRDWVRVGAAELGLDCLRRHLLGLPVDERIDFERRSDPLSSPSEWGGSHYVRRTVRRRPNEWLLAEACPFGYRSRT